VNYLDNRDSRQQILQLLVRAGIQTIAELNAVGAAPPMLRYDVLDILFTR
jgi:hypothetical protein